MKAWVLSGDRIWVTFMLILIVFSRKNTIIPLSYTCLLYVRTFQLLTIVTSLDVLLMPIEFYKSILDIAQWKYFSIFLRIL